MIMMPEQELAFHVGDQVVHWVYGLGEIVQLDEKKLSGQPENFYVVNIRDITLWVPISERGERCLRSLTPAKDYKKLFGILASPGEQLSTDRLERRNQLMERLKDGTLESICRVIRDLALYKQTQKMNENDNAIKNRATDFLLEEWSTVLSVPVQQADRELQKLLGAGVLAA